MSGGYDRDRGASAFLRRLEELENRGAHVTVGIHPDDGAEEHRGSRSAQTVAEVAVAQEFGVRRTRGGRRRHTSWLRRSFAQLKSQLRIELREAGVAYLQGQTAEHAFGAPGRTLLERMRELVGKDTLQLHDTMQVRVRGQAV